RGPPVVAAQRRHAVRAAAPSDLERLVQVRQPVLLLVVEHEQPAQVQRGQRVLVAVAERAGQLERALGRGARGGGALGQPLLPRQGDQGPDEPAVIPVLLPELGGGGGRRHGEVQLVTGGQRPRVRLAER